MASSKTDWVPVEACTLPSAEQPLRVAEFDDLFAAALRDIVRPRAEQVRLVLVGDDTLPARVQRLVDAETSCCSFFAFTLTRLDDEVDGVDGPGRTVLALDIRVPVARADVLAGLVARSRAALGAAS